MQTQTSTMQTLIVNDDYRRVRLSPYPDGIYLFKINQRNTRTGSEICSKLIIKTPERRRLCVSIGNFKQIFHIVLLFPMLGLNRQIPAGFLPGFSSHFHRHVLYDALDLVLMELIPELKDNYPQYLRDAIYHKVV